MWQAWAVQRYLKSKQIIFLSTKCHITGDCNIERFYNIYSHSIALVKKKKRETESYLSLLILWDNVRGKFLFPLLHCNISPSHQLCFSCLEFSGTVPTQTIWCFLEILGKNSRKGFIIWLTTTASIKILITKFNPCTKRKLHTGKG